MIERAVHLSGLTKQDFIIKRLQNKEIVVQGNPKVFRALKEELKEMMQELQRIASGGTVGSDLLDTIRLITVTLDGMERKMYGNSKRKIPCWNKGFFKSRSLFIQQLQEKYIKTFG